MILIWCSLATNMTVECGCFAHELLLIWEYVLTRVNVYWHILYYSPAMTVHRKLYLCGICQCQATMFYFYNFRRCSDKMTRRFVWWTLLSYWAKCIQNFSEMGKENKKGSRRRGSQAFQFEQSEETLQQNETICNLYQNKNYVPPDPGELEVVMDVTSCVFNWWCCFVCCIWQKVVVLPSWCGRSLSENLLTHSFSSEKNINESKLLILHIVSTQT